MPRIQKSLRIREKIVAAIEEIAAERESDFSTGVLIVPYSIRAHNPKLLARLLLSFASKHPKALPRYSLLFL